MVSTPHPALRSHPHQRDAPCRPAPLPPAFAYGSVLPSEENQVTEFKLTLAKATLVRVLNAFLNSNGGRVYFGVTDARRVLGAGRPGTAGNLPRWWGRPTLRPPHPGRAGFLAMVNQDIFCGNFF